MAWIVKVLVILICATRRAYAKKWGFLTFALSVFLVSVLFLAHFELLPNPLAKTVKNEPKITLNTSQSVSYVSAKNTQVLVREFPVKVEIPKIKLSVTVVNPNTTNAKVLDKDLLSGAVRYPKSARLGENGNVIIFGHSSYLPIVYNQAYKTFDGIQKLKKGNRIVVSSKNTAYVYSVDTVSKEESALVAISLSVARPTLTLSTCDSFGKKSERFVVTAHLVDSYPLES